MLSPHLRYLSTPEAVVRVSTHNHCTLIIAEASLQCTCIPAVSLEIIPMFYVRGQLLHVQPYELHPFLSFAERNAPPRLLCTPPELRTSEIWENALCPFPGHPTFWTIIERVIRGYNSRNRMQPSRKTSPMIPKPFLVIDTPTQDGPI
jgi:hypothetical protein